MAKTTMLMAGVELVIPFSNVLKNHLQHIL